MAAFSAEPLDEPKHHFADLAPRLLSGLVLGGLGLLSVWVRFEIFAVLWLGAAWAVLWEWQTLVAPATRFRGFFIGAAAAWLAMLLSFTGHFWFACGALGLAALIVAAVNGRGRMLWPAFGVLYAGTLVLSVIALRSSHFYGILCILWLYAIVWGTDIFAYFGGRLIGGARLSPKISPGKTWSGTLTGLFSGSALGTLLLILSLGHGFAISPIILWHSLVMFCLALAIAAVSQAGDLFESLVKRKFGVKNSGVLIPGHGGFMDRLDGFLAAAAFAALAGAAINPHSIGDGLLGWF